MHGQQNIKIHTEKLNFLYYSSNIVRMIKSRRIRLVEHVARMEIKGGV